jgi:geranylgeranyl pyrophosphate synthase
LDRALDIVRTSGAVAHARAGVAQEVARAMALAGRLPEGHAQQALVQLARFLAVRCGARVEPGALLGYGRAGEGANGS